MPLQHVASNIDLCFEQMFKQYFKPLCFYTMSYLGDDELAKDIIHDVFAEVWTRRVSIDFSQPLYPYLLRLTRNRCLNHLEHIKVQDRYIERELIFGENCHEMPDTEREEAIQKIINRIQQLPGKSKEVLSLYFLEKKRYKEIAALLNISVNTVKTHMSTGIRILRTEFSEQHFILFLGTLNTK